MGFKRSWVQIPPARFLIGETRLGSSVEDITVAVFPGLCDSQTYVVSGLPREQLHALASLLFWELMRGGRESASLSLVSSKAPGVDARGKIRPGLVHLTSGQVEAIVNRRWTIKGGAVVRNQRCLTPTDVHSRPTADTLEKDEALAKLAWAIAHPARVRLLRILLSRQACICTELVEQMPLAQSTVSQHLKILKESGLVIGEIEGPKVCYGVNPVALARLKELVGTL